MNTGTYGGNIYCDSCTLNFLGTTFRDSLAYEGSILFLLNTASVTFTNSWLKYGKARHYGGAIYTGGSGPLSLSISNCADHVTHYESK